MLQKHGVKLLVALVLWVAVAGTNVMGRTFGVEVVPLADAAGTCSGGGGC